MYEKRKDSHSSASDRKVHVDIGSFFSIEKDVMKLAVDEVINRLLAGELIAKPFR